MGWAGNAGRPVGASGACRRDFLCSCGAAGLLPVAATFPDWNCQLQGAPPHHQQRALTGKPCIVSAAFW